MIIETATENEAIEEIAAVFLKGTVEIIDFDIFRSTGYTSQLSRNSKPRGEGRQIRVEGVKGFEELEKLELEA